MNKSDFDIIAMPWAITRDALELAARQVRAGTFDQSFAGSAGRDADIKPQVRDGIALIPVRGALGRLAYNRVRAMVEAAALDPDVRAMVLRIDSPGGLVGGCKELADFVRAAGRTTPVYAYGDGTLCSAAYWIGSAAKLVAAPVTASVGSIGVRTLHIDWSGWNEKAGLKFTHLAAGRYKTMGNGDEPLGEEGRVYIQERLDRLYTIFVESVADYRGTTPDQARAMADGRVFLGPEALEAGLIDRIEQDFESFLSFISAKEKIMDLTTLKTDHSDLYARVIELGRAGAESDTAQKIKDAVAAETARITDLAGAVLDETAAKAFTALVNSGVTADAANSLKDLMAGLGTGHGRAGEKADKDSRARILEGLHQAHSQGVASGKETERPGDKSLDDQASEYVALVTG